MNLENGYKSLATKCLPAYTLSTFLYNALNYCTYSRTCNGNLRVYTNRTKLGLRAVTVVLDQKTNPALLALLSIGLWDLWKIFALRPSSDDEMYVEW